MGTKKFFFSNICYLILEQLMDRAIDVGDYFLEALKKLAEKHEIIGDIRGRGMFIGIDLVKDRETREPNIKAAEHALTRFREERILMQSDRPFNNVLKIKPPLAFSRENVDTFITTLDSIIEDIEDMQ